MKVVTARAPGKAVLLGEYAVLQGAPALAMAVDRQARVSIEACALRDCTVSAPQLGIDPIAFRPNATGHLDWDVSAEGWPRLERTATLLGFLHEQAVKRFGDPGPFRVVIDTEDLFMDWEGERFKLGLGSSAAVAVALDAGLRRFAGGDDEPGYRLALDRLLTPYRHGQDGQGSGIDLAASLWGGVISFQRINEDIQVQRQALPENVIFMFVWTGRPASTPEMLALYRRWRKESPKHAGRIEQEMKTICQAAQQAIKDGHGESLVKQFGDYGRVMGTMGSLMGADVISTEHARIQAGAKRLGLAYKPCGAGAGDLGMVAATDPERLRKMGDWLLEQGLPVLPLVIDTVGVQVMAESPGQD